ncbi:NucA/NucB deoxyribonuclease domain-containing protein [Actinokineospora iranica]|uniref:NucA/NucB deoxyribonuclease domain-containing protein n=1 Tax=Actinokineospora iranica TaxID=1271860 RepID=UPI0015877B01|nr:NucA/NucB deoxyribonuclease domain-containing protein [Actinokineospora iranica]
MATKTRSGALLFAAIAVVTVVAIPELRVKVTDLVEGITGGTELVGEVETQFMVAASAASQVRKCVSQRNTLDQDCDDLKFVMIDAQRMPFIARNISTAWKAGKPGVLTKDSTRESVNRRQVCRPSFPRPNGGQCDEFPFASTRQGGEGAQEHEVPARENRCQGGTLGRRYDAAGIRDGDDFLVVITHPSKIAPGPYQGVDIAKERGDC